MKKPELLAPAGTLKNLEFALAYGADAVYAGMPKYSLRVRENDFNRLENLQKGMEITHRMGKRFFLACNVLPHNNKVEKFVKDISPVMDMGPDALIMADPGLIALVRANWPGVPIHLSVQANTMNYAAVDFWASLGIRRIILSRELSLDEIEQIRNRCPGIELEVFVHGALCIAYSGRCLLSGYFNHRDANQGACTNACRWQYKVHEDGNGAEEKPQPLQTYYLEENQRPGQFMPIEEDEFGTYIMNSKDLRAIEHIERLTRMGIDSVKIEGRTKNYYYVARSTQSYRRAIDDAAASRPLDLNLVSQLDGLANRGYTDGFLQRHSDREHQNYLHSRPGGKSRFVGEITGFDRHNGLADVEVKNKLSVGDRLEIIRPQGVDSIILTAMHSMKGEAMIEAPGSGYQVKIPLPQADYHHALLARVLEDS